MVVPEVGLEPTLAEANTALNRARLPIPPLRQRDKEESIAKDERRWQTRGRWSRDSPEEDGPLGLADTSKNPPRAN